MTKMKVFAKKIGAPRLDGHRVTLRRGDVFYMEDYEPGVISMMTCQMVPRDGTDACKRLVAEEGKKWRALPKKERALWQHPAWFTKGLMPAVDFVHSHTPLRDSHGRFVSEEA